MFFPAEKKTYDPHHYRTRFLHSCQPCRLRPHTCLYSISSDDNARWVHGSCERVWAIRYARQRMGVVPGLLTRNLQRRADRRKGLGNGGRYAIPGAARRLVAPQCPRLPPGLSLQEFPGHPLQPHRVSDCSGCADSLALCSFALLPLASEVASARRLKRAWSDIIRCEYDPLRTEDLIAGKARVRAVTN